MMLFINVIREFLVWLMLSMLAFSTTDFVSEVFNFSTEVFAMIIALPLAIWVEI